MIKKWKEEWFKRKKTQLEEEYRVGLESFRKEIEAQYRTAYDESRKKYDDLIFKQQEVDELSKRLEERKIALAKENEELKTQLKILEAKSSPTNVWSEAFTAGFNKAWDMMFLQQEGMDRVKKAIEDKAIQDTLRRMNGNNPKTH